MQSIAAYLPVSDALGYYRCAISIGGLDQLDVPGVSDANWCSRRALYPAFLGSLLWLTLWRPSLVLIAQSAVIGLSLGLFVLVTARRLGWLVALTTATVVLVHAKEFALGNFMTESLGLPAGLLGLALLVHWEPDHDPWHRHLLAGVALLSLGLSARAGALFVLPFVALWGFAFSVRRLGWRQRMLLGAALGFGALAGPFLQLATVAVLGGNPFNTGGNFAPSLYGLATGSRNWGEAYKDFGEMFRTLPEPQVFAHVQRAAIDKIVAAPHVFLAALLAAGKHFYSTLFAFGPLVRWNDSLTFAYYLGLLACAVHLQKAPYALLLTIAAGEAISAPLVVDSGGSRLFAVTIAARAAVAAFSLAVLFRLVAQRLPGVRNRLSVDQIRNDLAAGVARTTVAAGAALAVLVSLPLLRVLPLNRLDRVPAPGRCESGQVEVVVRPSQGVLRLRLGDRRLPVNEELLGVTYARLMRSPEFRGAWWKAGLPELPPGAELLYLMQLNDPHAGMVVPAFSLVPLDLSGGGTASVCFVKDAQPRVRLGDWDLDQIVAVRR